MRTTDDEWLWLGIAAAVVIGIGLLVAMWDVEDDMSDDPDAQFKLLLARERELRHRHRVWQELTLASVMAAIVALAVLLIFAPS